MFPSEFHENNITSIVKFIDEYLAWHANIIVPVIGRK